MVRAQRRVAPFAPGRARSRLARARDGGLLVRRADHQVQPGAGPARRLGGVSLMQKTRPTIPKLAIMVVFALSCFAIVLFLWKSFGGPSQLAAKEYTLVADFNEATQLSDTADVRIAGVSVGRVEKTELHGQRTRVTMQIDARYAPLPRDTRAILRQKTLLGETYVEMTPGDPSSGRLPDGGLLPPGQVHKTVELDEVTRQLDKRAQHDLQRFVRGFAAATSTHGLQLSDALGNLSPFSSSTGRLLAALDAQHDAVRRLVHDSGVVFGALGRRQ